MAYHLAVLLSLIPSPRALNQEPARQETASRPAVPSLAERVPADVMVYARLASLGRAAEEVRTQAPWRIWQEEEVQTFWQSVREKMLSGAVAGDFSAALESLDQLRRAFGGPVTFVARETPESDNEPRSAFAFEGCTIGKAAVADVFLDELIRGPLAPVLRGKPVVEQVGGLKLRTFPHPVRDLFAAASGTTMVLGDDKGLVVALCGAGAAPKETLAACPEFRAALASAGAPDPTVFMFIHTGSAVDHMNAGDRAEAATAGIDNVRGIGLSLWARGGEVFDRVTLQAPGGRAGFLLGLAPGPTKAAASKAAPATTLFMSAIPVDLPALYAVTKAMGEKGNSDMNMLRGLEEMLVGRLQLKLNEDLLQPLGKELTFLVILPSGSALIPELALLAEVRNEAALEKNLDAVITNSLEKGVKETTFSGHKIRYVSLGEGGGSFLSMSPSYTFAGGYLVIGSHPNVVKRILNTIDGKAPSLAKDESFQKAFARATADGDPAGLVYFNTKRAFEYLHGIFTPLLGMFGGREELPFDPASIPTAESVSKHLSVAVNALRLPKDGLEIRSFSDGISLSTLCIYGFAAAACFEARSVIQARNGSSMQCHANLRDIAAKIELYRKANKTYPAKAAEIWGEHLPEWQRNRNGWMETCREDKEHAGEDALSAVKEGQIESYAWFPEELSLGARETFTPDVMLLYERKPFHRGCRMVLFAGGNTDWLPEEEFQKRLAAQSAAAKKGK